jgi:uncharacterized protein (TIGR01777 family)
MKFLVTGASGLIGHALVSFFKKDHHDVHTLVRARADLLPNEIAWDPEQGVINSELLENFDAVVHLAGENIAGFWTAAKKRRILDSRVHGTKLLCRTLSQLKNPPKVLISASAIGIYGHQGSKILNESSPTGTDFLANVCKQWEAATLEAKNKGIRVVNLRTGIVLSKEGGALKKMLTPFKLGLGGKIGDGQQYMSWIAIDDLIAAIVYAIEHNEISGPMNAVSLNPVTNQEFTKTLGHVLNRPTFMSIPKTIIQWLMGEMGEELLLNSQRVKPDVLLANGFRFQYSTLDEALKSILYA